MVGKRMLVGIAVTVTVVVMGTAGCFKSQKGLNSEPEPDDRIVLEVYAWQDEEENLAILADAFMKQYPDIEIHTNFVPVTQYVQQMQILKSRGNQVDCILNPNAAQAMVMKNKKIIKDLGPWTGESIFLLPYRMSRWVVYYNKTLFDQLGVDYPEPDWTWQDYEETAVQLTRQVDGEQTYGSLSFDPSNIWWRVPARTAGANNPLAKKDMEEFKKAAEWCYRLTYELGAQMPYSDRTGTSGAGYEGVFLKGNIGMFFCGDWSVAVLNKEIEKSYPDFVYDVAPMPHWEGQDGWVISDAAVVSVAEDTQYSEEAFMFVEFVSGQQGAEILAANSVIPALPSPEISRIFSEVTKLPEHTEYFFTGGNVSSTPADSRYDEAMEIMRNEVMLYLLQEQSLEKTFQIIEAEIGILE